MSKIKSIKIEKQYIPLTLLNEVWLQKLDQKKPPEGVTIYSDGVKVEIEYESEPKFLKRPDGSLISEPEEDEKVIIIGEEFEGFEDHYSADYEINLRLGRVFLLKDKHLAEKKAKMLTKQLEITNEIERLNAEENWVADWSDSNQTKCSFRYKHNCKEIISNSCWQYQSGVLVSSEEILDKIQDKYSEDELKQFLGIII